MIRSKLAVRLVIGLALVAGIAVGAARLTAEETPKKIRIICTDDMQGAWIPCG